MARKTRKEQAEVLKNLSMVQGAARLTWSVVAENKHEAWFRMYGQVL